MCNGENNSSNKQKKILYYLNTKEKKTVIACNFQTYICFSLPLFLIRCTGFSRIGTTLSLSEFLSGILLLFLLLHVCPLQGDLGTTIRVSREKKKKPLKAAKNDQICYYSSQENKCQPHWLSKHTACLCTHHPQTHPLVLLPYIFPSINNRWLCILILNCHLANQNYDT